MSHIVITSDGTAEEMAQALIANSLPPRTLHQVDLGTSEGMAFVMRRLTVLSQEASLEKDEIVEFALRNRAAIAAGQLDSLRLIASMMGAESDFHRGLKLLADNVGHVMAGHPERIDLKSDRLLWLIYALAFKRSQGQMSWEDAIATLDMPEHRQRISRASLVFMIADISSQIGRPQEPPVEMLMLVAECGVLVDDRVAVALVLAILPKFGAPAHRGDMTVLLERCSTYLASRGGLNDGLLKAMAEIRRRERPSVRDEDF